MHPCLRLLPRAYPSFRVPATALFDAEKPPSIPKTTLLTSAFRHFCTKLLAPRVNKYGCANGCRARLRAPRVESVLPPVDAV